MSQTLRIGNAQAFWGDRTAAAAEMLCRDPDLDYLTLDYLAEVSMSILAFQRQQDRHQGFAHDFVDVIQSLAPYWAAGGRCRVIANAGGLNPVACAAACRHVLEQTGCRSLRIGIVDGDDVRRILQSEAAGTIAAQFNNLDTGESLGRNVDRLLTANAYLGADPIVQALVEGADIVITGRVADPSMVVAACRHHFQWNASDLDPIAGATVAGHLIECGTQVCGGISTDWMHVPDVAQLGFPIVEVEASGACTVTKSTGSGGCVSGETVREQLVYEIGDPSDYRSPDMGVSFESLRVDDLGSDRVRVTGAIGRPHPPRYKVSATLRDGYRSAGTLVIVGRDAVCKAQRCGEIVLQRVRDAGFEIRDSVIEFLGHGACAAGVLQPNVSQDRRLYSEVVLRIAVETQTQAAAERFARELMPLITSGPQGTTGYSEGRPHVRPVIRYWPCLIDRELVTPRVQMIQSIDTSRVPRERPEFDNQRKSPQSDDAATEARVTLVQATAASVFCGDDPPRGDADDQVERKQASTLLALASARSGDKGTSANIGVLARSDHAWEFLRDWLTADRVAEFLAPLGVASVERFELKNLTAFNFMVYGILSNRLRTDVQGKTLGQLLLEMPLPRDFVPKMEVDKR